MARIYGRRVPVVRSGWDLVRLGLPELRTRLPNRNALMVERAYHRVDPYELRGEKGRQYHRLACSFLDSVRNDGRFASALEIGVW